MPAALLLPRPRPTPLPSLLLGLLPLALGCDPDCRDPSRLDGSWAVFSNAGTEQALITGFQDDEPLERNELLSAVFANGESTWELTYVPNRSNFTLRVNDQPYEASYETGEGSCNGFTLDFEGTYTSETESQHHFSWSGDLVWSGDELNGVYGYEDSWVWAERSGTLSMPEGQMRGEPSE